MLTIAETGAARRDLAALLSDRCTIRRRSAAGTWSTLASDVPCRLTLSGSAVSGEQVSASADPRGSAVLTLPAGTNVGDEAAVGQGDLRFDVAGRRFVARLVVPREAFLMRVIGEVEG